VPTWVPDDRDRLDDLARDVAALFEQAEQRLRTTLAAQVSQGLRADPEQVAKQIRLDELQRDAQQIVAELRQMLPDQISRLLQVAQEHGALAALQDMSDLAGVPDPTTALQQVAGAPAAQSLVGDLTNMLDDLTARILRWPDDVYRRAIAQSTTDLLLGMGATQTSVQARAWHQLVAQGVSGFTDRAGRRWNLGTYVEMASRTAARRAWESQHTATLTQNGVNLVSIIVGRGACERCAAWAGLILRIDDGPIGALTLPSMTDPDKHVTVTVAGTLAQARAAGWRHPNCRCRPVAYMPGLSVVADVTTYDPDAEAARAKLRDLEVQVRKAKADAAAAVDPEQRRAANATARGLQTQIRAHVDEHQLMRQRRREQISLGNPGGGGDSVTAPRAPYPSQRPS